MNTRIIRKDQMRAATRFPLIGRIRCGEKRKSNSTGKEYPVSLDYFKATGDYAAKFEEVYPGKPDTIQVIFISDDDSQSCFEQWDGRDPEGRKAGYGDGENWYIFNPGTNQYDHTKDQELVKKVSEERQIKWKPVLTLNFLIPKIRGVFGIWQFQTSGDKSSTIAITSVYDEIKAQAGTVVNVPFDLTVKKVKSNKPGSKSVYPVVNLIPNISHENMEQLRQFMSHGIDVKRIGILTEENLRSLPAPEEDAEAIPVATDEDTSQERSPENGAKNEPPEGTLFEVKEGDPID